MNEGSKERWNFQKKGLAGQGPWQGVRTRSYMRDDGLFGQEGQEF